MKILRKFLSYQALKEATELTFVDDDSKQYAVHSLQRNYFIIFESNQLRTAIELCRVTLK